MSTSYTQTQPRERGWAVAAIRRFLGEPDHVGGWSRTYYLYASERVHAAEQTPEYRAWQEQGAARSARSKASAIRGRKRRLRSLHGWKPDFDVADDVSLDDVIDEAIDDHTAWQDTYRDEPNYASRQSDPRFLHRKAVNYLRHSVTDYDDMLRSLRGRVGVRDAENLVRERVYDAIATRFPSLASECDTQLRRRRAA